MDHYSTRSFNRQNRYRISVLLGAIFSLAILVAFTKVPLTYTPPEVAAPLNGVINTPIIIPTKQQQEKPPTPKRPSIPILTSDDDLLDDDEFVAIDMLSLEMTLPDSPPAPATDENVDDEIEPFITVEEMPQLIGGIKGLISKVSYPAMARKAGVEGTVVIQFVVDTNGDVTEAFVFKGIGAGCDEVALKAIQASRFTPGRQRGKAVPVIMSLPVRFKLK